MEPLRISGPVICFILCAHTCMLTTPSCPLYVHTHWCDVGKLSVSWPTLADPAALWFPLGAVSLWVWYISVFVAHTSLLCLYVCAHVSVCPCVCPTAQRMTILHLQWHLQVKRSHTHTTVLSPDDTYWSLFTDKSLEWCFILYLKLTVYILMFTWKNNCMCFYFWASSNQIRHTSYSFTLVVKQSHHRPNRLCK